MIDVEYFVDADKAAEFLGLDNRRTAVRWARTGIIPGHPLGAGKRKIWRFRLSELASWVLNSGNPSVLSRR